MPQGGDNDYVQRGERENRNKELKIDLCGGRLSDHWFMANLFRLLLHSVALNLMICLSRTLPDAPPQDCPPSTVHNARHQFRSPHPSAVVISSPTVESR